MAREQRRLAAIVAADVVNYSRLMGRDENALRRLPWNALRRSSRADLPPTAGLFVTPSRNLLDLTRGARPVVDQDGLSFS